MPDFKEVTDMICFVDNEHESVADVFNIGWFNDEKGLRYLGRRAALKFRFEELCGQACLLQHYTRVTEEKLREWDVQALLISGYGTTWERFDPKRIDPLLRIIRESDIPIIGFCGGHQTIGYAFDTPSVPMGPLPEGMEDPNPNYGAGMRKESGFTPVEILESDPLFEGLGERPVFMEAHWWEVQDVPPGFRLLATNDACRVQAFKHDSRLLYGVQFHPEAYDQAHQDGKALLKNFFRIAGLT
jgi:GMP synthase-like glutamine amidotransferase